MNNASKAEANLFRAASAWALASAGRRWESEALLCTTCPIQLRSFNQIFVKSAALDTQELADTLNAYRLENPRFRVRLRSDFEQNLAPVMKSVGLQRRGGIPSMVLERAAAAPRSEVGLHIRPVVDQHTLTDHVAVVADAFEWQPMELAGVFTPRLLSEECWSGWVGYLEDVPVAASQLVMHEGVGGIYYVAAVGAHRGRGFGEAITRRAVEHAESRSCVIVSLQASPAGYPVYVRIGFRKVAEYVTYIDHEGAQHD